MNVCVSEREGGSECMNDALSLSEHNAVDDDNPVGEDHHLEETFDDFNQHPLDTHDTSHDIDPMGKPLSLYKIVLPVCVYFIVLRHLVERR